jgi:hypothetical protein
VADRIRVNVVATPKLKDAIQANEEYVTTETLTVELSFSEPVPGFTISTDEFDGEKVTVGLVKSV